MTDHEDPVTAGLADFKVRASSTSCTSIRTTRCSRPRASAGPWTRGSRLHDAGRVEEGARKGPRLYTSLGRTADVFDIPRPSPSFSGASSGRATAATSRHRTWCRPSYPQGSKRRRDQPSAGPTRSQSESPRTPPLARRGAAFSPARPHQPAHRRSTRSRERRETAPGRSACGRRRSQRSRAARRNPRRAAPRGHARARKAPGRSPRRGRPAAGGPPRDPPTTRSPRRAPPGAGERRPAAGPTRRAGGRAGQISRPRGLAHGVAPLPAVRQVRQHEGPRLARASRDLRRLQGRRFREDELAEGARSSAAVRAACASDSSTSRVAGSSGRRKSRASSRSSASRAAGGASAKQVWR